MKAIPQGRILETRGLSAAHELRLHAVDVTDADPGNRALRADSPLCVVHCVLVLSEAIQLHGLHIHAVVLILAALAELVLERRAAPCLPVHALGNLEVRLNQKLVQVIVPARRFGVGLEISAANAERDDASAIDTLAVSRVLHVGELGTEGGGNVPCVGVHVGVLQVLGDVLHVSSLHRKAQEALAELMTCSPSEGCGSEVRELGHAVNEPEAGVGIGCKHTLAVAAVHESAVAGSGVGIGVLVVVQHVCKAVLVGVNLVQSFAQSTARGAIQSLVGRHGQDAFGFAVAVPVRVLEALRHLVHHPPVDGIADLVDAAYSCAGIALQLLFIGVDGSVVAGAAGFDVACGAFVDADVSAGHRLAGANFATLVVGHIVDANR